MRSSSLRVLVFIAFFCRKGASLPRGRCGLQFLAEGARRGESVLYITLAETAEELKAVAFSHGWDMNGIRIHEVLPSQDLLNPEQQYTIFHASEMEMASTLQQILSGVER